MEKEALKAADVVGQVSSGAGIAHMIDKAAGGFFGKAIDKLNGKEGYMGLRSKTPACGVIGMQKWLKIEKKVRLSAELPIKAPSNNFARSIDCNVQISLMQQRILLGPTPFFINVQIHLIMSVGLEGNVDDCMAKPGDPKVASQHGVGAPTDRNTVPCPDPA